jgi:hypothetical protein
MVRQTPRQKEQQSVGDVRHRSEKHDQDGDRNDRGQDDRQPREEIRLPPDEMLFHRVSLGLQGQIAQGKRGANLRFSICEFANAGGRYLSPPMAKANRLDSSRSRRFFSRFIARRSAGLPIVIAAQMQKAVNK